MDTLIRYEKWRGKTFTFLMNAFGFLKILIYFRRPLLLLQFNQALEIDRE